jgi:hypothetical protein
MSPGTTCANECSCYDYQSALVALYVKCISLYGVLCGCQIAASLTEPDYYPDVGISPPIHAALGSRLQSLSRAINDTLVKPDGV